MSFDTEDATANDPSKVISLFYIQNFKFLFSFDSKDAMYLGWFIAFYLIGDAIIVKIH